jgi:hypothetical protein
MKFPQNASFSFHLETLIHYLAPISFLEKFLVRENSQLVFALGYNIW